MLLFYIDNLLVWYITAIQNILFAYFVTTLHFHTCLEF